jgi:hypothetical protein
MLHAQFIIQNNSALGRFPEGAPREIVFATDDGFENIGSFELKFGSFIPDQSAHGLLFLGQYRVLFPLVVFIGPIRII